MQSLSSSLPSPLFPDDTMSAEELAAYAESSASLKKIVQMHTYPFIPVTRFSSLCNSYQPAAGAPESLELAARLYNKLIPGLGVRGAFLFLHDSWIDRQSLQTCVSRTVPRKLLWCVYKSLILFFPPFRLILCQVFVEKGVAVACFDPAYPLYHKQIFSIGGTLIPSIIHHFAFHLIFSSFPTSFPSLYHRHGRCSSSQQTYPLPHY